MNIEKHVCSPDLSKRLSLLGVTASESAFYWVGSDNALATFAELITTWHVEEAEHLYWNAYTVEELLVHLPTGFHVFRGRQFCSCMTTNKKYTQYQPIVKPQHADSLADAAAKMLIWLLENDSLIR